MPFNMAVSSITLYAWSMSASVLAHSASTTVRSRCLEPASFWRLRSTMMEVSNMRSPTGLAMCTSRISHGPDPPACCGTGQCHANTAATINEAMNASS